MGWDGEYLEHLVLNVVAPFPQTGQTNAAERAKEGESDEMVVVQCNH